MIVGRLIASQTVTTSIGQRAIELSALTAAAGLFVLVATRNRVLAAVIVILLGLLGCSDPLSFQLLSATFLRQIQLGQAMA